MEGGELVSLVIVIGVEKEAGLALGRDSNVSNKVGSSIDRRNKTSSS